MCRSLHQTSQYRHLFDVRLSLSSHQPRLGFVAGLETYIGRRQIAGQELWVVMPRQEDSSNDAFCSKRFWMAQLSWVEKTTRSEALIEQTRRSSIRHGMTADAVRTTGSA
jgi:hypothetical protein